MTTDNPYAAPAPASEPTTPIEGPLPRSAYISAGCSGAFVFVGAMFVGAALLYMFAPGLAELAVVSFFILFFLSLGAAVVSSWETLQLARRRKLAVSEQADDSGDFEEAEIV